MPEDIMQKNRIACTFLSSSTIFSTFLLFLMPFWKMRHYGILDIFLWGYIFLYSSIETQNKTLNVEEFTKHRRKTRKLLCMIMIIALEVYFVKVRVIVQSVTISLFIVFLCVWGGRRNNCRDCSKDKHFES